MSRLSAPPCSPPFGAAQRGSDGLLRTAAHPDGADLHDCEPPLEASSGLGAERPGAGSGSYTDAFRGNIDT